MRKQILLISLSLIVLSVDAQIEKLAGPRIGITAITPGLLSNVLRKDVKVFSDENREEWTGSLGKYGSVTTQYGWQWESRFADGEKIVGIVEWVALVGGIEKGFFLPSISSIPEATIPPSESAVRECVVVMTSIPMKPKRSAPTRMNENFA